ncbi:MAG: TIGR03663 family protein [Chloroflexota bacterium]|nr:TIGR03663 family protein [Chloroflexota bacterium]
MKTQSRTAPSPRPSRTADDLPDAVEIVEEPLITVRPSGSAMSETRVLESRPVRTAAPTVIGQQSAVAAPTDSWLTLENGLYLLFFVLALVSRFWDLGFKGLHHDESLHAVFSWKYYTNLGYVHSPMMHGPEQFHFIDLFYLLFGATDATARYASATCGVILAMSPWFLRRQLGRWPALIATFLILISPSLLYHARFAREDSIYAAMEMLFVLGLWRFVDERKPRDFYIMCAGYALMFTIKESAYLTTAVIGGLLVALFAWQTGRALFTTFVGYLVLLGGAALTVLKLVKTAPLPSIPAQDPTPDNIRQFVTDLLGHPLIWAVGAVTILWLAVWGYLLWDQSRRVRSAAAAMTPAAGPALALTDSTNGHTVAAVPSPALDLSAGEPTHVLTDTMLEHDLAAEPLIIAPTVAATTVDDSAAAGNGYDDVPWAGNEALVSAGNGYAQANGHDLAEITDQIAATTVSDDIEPAEVEIEGEPSDGELEGEPIVIPPRARRAKPVKPATVRAVDDTPGLLERYQPGSLPYAVGYLLRHPTVLITGFALATLLYVALYTSLFSNINGIGTGLFGSIGYWLAQQDVRRGDQPWFYYFVLIPIYEPLIILFGFTGILYFLGKGIGAWRARRAVPRERGPVVPGATAGFNVGKPVEFAEMRPFLVLFLTVWFAGALALYSWAGEKMPWLTTHIVHPLAFLAALALGQLIKSMIRHRRARAAEYVEPMDEVVAAPTLGRKGAVPTRTLRPVTLSPWQRLTNPLSWVPFFAFLSLFLVVSVFWAMSITHRVANDNYTDWWQLAIFPALLLLLIGAFWSLVGGSRVLRYTLTGLLFLLATYGLRSAIQLAYFNPMDAREMIVYVQTAPDATRAADTIDRLSVDQTGARDLKVMYDSQTSWPWEWYLRDYKNKNFVPGGPSAAPDTGVQVMVVDSAWYDKAKSGQAPQLDNYVGTKYAMRWWFPEDTYRVLIPNTWDKVDPAKPTKEDGSPNYALDDKGKQIKEPVGQIKGALDTILYTLRTPSEQGKLWKYLIYRQPYASLGSTDMAVFVRKDLVDRYNYLASLNLPNYDAEMSH